MVFTLDELCSQVALALSLDYAGAPNERIRDVPDRRTVRYYTMLGLIDRPAAMKGRRALYTRRHLLQLIAIKRLQTTGLSLNEVQQQLFGKSDTQLATIAQLPEAEATGAPPEPKPRREFWKETPEPAAADEPTAQATVVQGVPLDDRIVLLLPLRRTPDAMDLEALRVAAEPLLSLLRRRRLIE